MAEAAKKKQSSMSRPSQRRVTTRARNKDKFSGSNPLRSLGMPGRLEQGNL